MLVDYPAAYRGQPGIEFLKNVPTSWDGTRVLDGRVGEFITVARRSGKQWYVGSMTNWARRELSIPLRFLGPGRYRAEVLCGMSRPTRPGSADNTFESAPATWWRPAWLPVEATSCGSIPRSLNPSGDNPVPALKPAAGPGGLGSGKALYSSKDRELYTLEPFAKFASR